MTAASQAAHDSATGRPRPTREQRIVDRLVLRLPASERLAALEAMEGRAQALPALLRRHGPVQVLLFLTAKGSGDESGRERSDLELARCLVTGIEAAFGGESATGDAAAPEDDIARYAEELAEKPLSAYLLRWEVALEVAGWIKLLVGARRQQSAAARAGAAGSHHPEGDATAAEAPPAPDEATS